MQRDMDLIRQILFRIEEYKHFGTFIPVEVEGYTEEEISYHIKLLAEADFVEAQDCGSAGWQATSMTWDGHEFLDAAKDETRWNQAKSLIAEKGGGLVLDVLKPLLVLLFKNSIGL